MLRGCRCAWLLNPLGLGSPADAMSAGYGPTKDTPPQFLRWAHTGVHNMQKELFAAALRNRTFGCRIVRRGQAAHRLVSQVVAARLETAMRRRVPCARSCSGSRHCSVLRKNFPVTKPSVLPSIVGSLLCRSPGLIPHPERLHCSLADWDTVPGRPSAARVLKHRHAAPTACM